MAWQYHTIDPDLYVGEELVRVGGCLVRVNRHGEYVTVHPKTYGATHAEWGEALGVSVRRVDHRSRTHTLVFVKEVSGE